MGIRSVLLVLWLVVAGCLAQAPAPAPFLSADAPAVLEAAASAAAPVQAQVNVFPKLHFGPVFLLWSILAE